MMRREFERTLKAAKDGEVVALDADQVALSGYPRIPFPTNRAGRARLRLIHAADDKLWFCVIKRHGPTYQRKPHVEK